MGPWLTFLAVAIYGLVHSLLASTAVKSKIQSSLGNRFMQYYRMIYNVLGILTFLPVLAVPAIWPGPILYQLSGIWMAIALLGQVLAVGFLLLSLRQTDVWHFLGVRQLVDGSTKEGQELVVGGLYRCVRHPLYAAGLVFLWLTPVMTTSTLALILSLSLYILIGSVFEEKRLQREFGVAYQAYRNEVPRLIPRLGKCFGAE
jgi:protein-S-isoprenylcysteine O-methyltransferase Ste14